MKKIDITLILMDHFKTLYSNKSKRISFGDISTFYLVPFCIGITFYFFPFPIKDLCIRDDSLPWLRNVLARTGT